MGRPGAADVIPPCKTLRGSGEGLNVNLVIIDIRLTVPIYLNNLD
ncbi:hypothetical protein SynSYN20_00820 [Synechococcus sp. SYN20]|nr:hypothetical protein SynSYN20_00820 [Synechococcus sp. SYN20]